MQQGLLHKDPQECCAPSGNGDLFCHCTSFYLQAIVDEAVTRCGSDGHEVPHVAVWHNAHAGKRADTPFQGGRDAWWHDVVDSQSAHCEIVWLDAETPLFKVWSMPVLSMLNLSLKLHA